MEAAKVVKEVAAACAYPSTARQGAVVAGIAADGGVGTVGTAGAGRQRQGVAAGALEGAEGVEGPDGTRAAACRRRRLAVVGDEAKEARGPSGVGVTVRERRSLVGAGATVL
jgi:hypothetical protein